MRASPCGAADTRPSGSVATSLGGCEKGAGSRGRPMFFILSKLYEFFLVAHSAAAPSGAGGRDPDLRPRRALRAPARDRLASGFDRYRAHPRRPDADRAARGPVSPAVRGRAAALRDHHSGRRDQGRRERRPRSGRLRRGGAGRRGGAPGEALSRGADRVHRRRRVADGEPARNHEAEQAKALLDRPRRRSGPGDAGGPDRATPTRTRASPRASFVPGRISDGGS